MVVGGKTYVRMTENLHRLGPKPSDHPSVLISCPACGKLFSGGDYTTMIPLGPGDVPVNQEHCREGQSFFSVAIEVHWSCATGFFS